MENSNNPDIDVEDISQQDTGPIDRLRTKQVDTDKIKASLIALEADTKRRAVSADTCARLNALFNYARKIRRADKMTASILYERSMLDVDCIMPHQKYSDWVVYHVVDTPETEW